MLAPFPWYGGKRRVAARVWERLGADVTNYVEPFAGSLAMLLGRPGWTLDDPPTAETINDLDGYVANFWRSVAHDPEAVARWADWPVNENDLHARHVWLVERKEQIVRRLEGDPDYYDAKVAGWWVWGISVWIGSSFCSGSGPWQAVEDDEGHRKLVHVGDPGMGVHRQLVHVGDPGMGVHRQLVHVGNPGMGDAGDGLQGLYAWIEALSERLRRVRVCCGDWKRICDSTATLFPIRDGTCGVFLDPPYSQDERCAELYTVETNVAEDVLAWCRKWGQHERLRIALCGYEGECHDALTDEGWSVEEWKSDGGYGNQAGADGAGRTNRTRERIWYSPGCGGRKQTSLF